MKGALIDGCFTEKTYRNLIGFLVLCRECYARSQRNLSADNAVTTKEVDVLVEHMHRPALAL